MKHLILGSSGVIGKSLFSYIAQELSDGEITGDVRGFDIAQNELHDLTIPNNTLIEAAIQWADVVYFLAYDVGGSKYLEKHKNSISMLQNNSKMMDNVFGLLEKYNKKFIFASSQMSTMKHSGYGMCKAIGEHYTETLGGLIVKFWNVYGPEPRGEKAHVITDFILKATEDKVIKMRTNGSEARQFLFTSDCAEALLQCALNYDKLLPNEVDKNPLHITSFYWVTINEIAQKIAKMYGDVPVVTTGATDQVQRGIQNEPQNYIKTFWTPTINLETGIKACAAAQGIY